VSRTPTAGPWIAAIDGLRQEKIASTKPRPGRWPESPDLPNTLAPCEPDVSKLLAPPDTSAPAQNARPAPVTITARTTSSASVLSNASISSNLLRTVNAFLLSG